MLKHGILGLLNYCDMTGYEIMEAFRDSLKFFWNAQTSQIYRELQGLEKKRWVSKTVVSQQKRPDKHVYSITEAGKEELIRWLAEEGPGLDVRAPILMKVFFLGERSREENIRFFQQYRDQCEKFMESMEAVPGYISEYSSYVEDKEKTIYWQMTMDYGRRKMQMCMDWAQDCIRKLEE
ncbi:MAG: PadR family transcriptional regulator [Lachnospiraceae bacterium]|nr:PadR family transcriptional regulator [Lachnospiraceae bacterium]